MDISDYVRQQIINYMRRKQISQVELAKQLGKKPQTLNTMLLHRRGVSVGLAEVLDALDLELTVTPKKPQEEKPKPAYLSLIGLLDDANLPNDASTNIDRELGKALESEHQGKL